MNLDGQPFPTEHLNRCLGPARDKDKDISQHVLLENGNVIPIQTLQTLQSLTKAEIDSPFEQLKNNDFDKSIKKLYGDDKYPPVDWIKRKGQYGGGVQYINKDDEVDKNFGNEEALK